MKALSPTAKNAFGTEFERVFPASSVANLFPFSYSGKNDKNGFYIGRDQNGSNIIVDFDRRAEDKTNGHILILGNSGEGKSYLMKLIITNVIMAGKKYISSTRTTNTESLLKILAVRIWI